MYKKTLPLILLLLLLIFCNTNETKPSNLDFERSIVDVQDTIFFKYNNYIDMQDSIILVNDILGEQVNAISKSGDLLSKFGGSGRGPGEYVSPYISVLEGEKVYVYDGNLSKILVFNLNGKFIDEFLLKDSLYEFDIYEGKIYSFSFRKEDDKLIKIYNLNGDFIKSFGSPLALDAEKNVNNLIKITVFKDKVYVLFLYYPVLKIFNLNGDLINSYNLLNDFDYLKRVNQSEVTNKTPNITSHQFIFKSMSVSDGGIFLGIYDQNPVFDFYDLNMNPIKRYEANIGKKEFIHYHSVVVDSTVYVSGAFPESGIHVFKLNNK